MSNGNDSNDPNPKEGVKKSRLSRLVEKLGGSVKELGREAAGAGKGLLHDTYEAGIDTAKRTIKEGADTIRDAAIQGLEKRADEFTDGVDRFCNGDTEEKLAVVDPFSKHLGLASSFPEQEEDKAMPDNIYALRPAETARYLIGATITLTGTDGVKYEFLVSKVAAYNTLISRSNLSFSKIEEVKISEGSIFDKVQRLAISAQSPESAKRTSKHASSEDKYSGGLVDILEVIELPGREILNTEAVITRFQKLTGNTYLSGNLKITPRTEEDNKHSYKSVTAPTGASVAYELKK